MRRNYIATQGGVQQRNWLLVENCEGTGTPAAWTTVSGSPNWDYTTVPLAGAQSLYQATAAAVGRVRADFTDQAEVWIYFLIRLTNGAFSGIGTTFGGLGANGGALVQGFNINPTNHFSFASVATTAVISADVTYHMWLYYKQGTGADSVSSIAHSTDGIRPTSGTSFNQQSNLAGTNLGGRLFIGPTVTTLGWDVIWDNFRVANTQIGDYGT